MLKLKANSTVSQRVFTAKFYTAMNAFIYEILEGNEELKGLHDKHQFKGFCFGNVYPVREERINEGGKYNLVISSSMPKIIEKLFFGIPENSKINLGEGSFSVEEVSILNFDVKPGILLETLSIINLTKNADNGIKPLLFPSDEGYLKQLAQNLVRKHNQLTSQKVPEDLGLFENINVRPLSRNDNTTKFSIPLVFDDNKKFNCIGNKLSFEIGNISETQQAVLQTAFDAGFGERNAFGMGFMVMTK